jgi:hypothetical protein
MERSKNGVHRCLSTPRPTFGHFERSSLLGPLHTILFLTESAPGIEESTSSNGSKLTGRQGLVERRSGAIFLDNSSSQVWRFLKRYCRWRRLDSPLSKEATHCRPHSILFSWILRILLPWLILPRANDRVTSLQGRAKCFHQRVSPHQVSSILCNLQCKSIALVEEAPSEQMMQEMGGNRAAMEAGLEIHHGMALSNGAME